MSISKGSILIVDHDASARGMLLSLLSRECYYCVATSSAEDALDNCATQDFDVVILDAITPGATVAELLPKLVNRCHETQFIVAVSSMDGEAIEQSIRLGASDYVMKPYNNSDVVERVEAAISRKRMAADKK